MSKANPISLTYYNYKKREVELETSHQLGLITTQDYKKLNQMNINDLVEKENRAHNGDFCLVCNSPIVTCKCKKS
jgi:hypothetical protein